MPANLSIRCCCMDVDGTIYNVPIRLAQEMRSTGVDLIKSGFAGSSIRFTEFVVRLEDRRPIEIIQESHYLIRFNADGRPDMERYKQEVHASMNAMWDGVFGPEVKDGNVIHMENRFKSNGNKWRPTLQDLTKLRSVVFGEVKAPRLRFD